MEGIAGLGTVGGRVYLVDLALDEANESTDVEPASLALLTHPAARRDIPGYVRLTPPPPSYPPQSSLSNSYMQYRYCTDIISIIIF